MAMGRQHFASPAHTSATAYPQQSGMLDMEMPAGDEVQIATAPESSRVTGQPLTPDDSGLRPADGTSLSTEFFGESSTFDFMNKVWSPDSAESPRGPSSLSNVRVLPGAVIAGKTSCSLATSSPSAPIFDDLPLGLGTDDAFGLPHRFVADRLVDAYFKFRHPLNAYLHENSFRSRYQRLWLSEDLGGEEATQNNLAWLGLVNLVFAFGSEYARVASRSAAAADRLRFFKRAKTLVFSGLLQAGSIELIQALLLMGQYLHGSLELNNCWTVVGLAIRTAQGLGLHRGEFTADIVEHEVRKRVWWGCFIIDRVLSMKVGRPPTIHDGPAIKVGLPLAVDDEYIVNDDARGGPPVQPPGIPSKLDFINQVIPLCRLLERILDTLYSGGGGCTPCQADASKPKLTDIPNLLAISIQLEGDLDTWQQALPAHLRFDSQVQGWHFERQRNTLLMRFLSCRLLVHRQVLLIYITRRITDSFQREIMHCCVRRCIMAAHDTVRQMQQLHQRHLLHSWWHNSHHVFAALGVLLAFQTLDTQSKAEVGLVSVDVDQVILRGTHLLEEVGDQMHPLASRYVQSFHQLQNRLRAISTARAYGGSKSSSSAVPHDTSSLNGIYSDPNSNPALTDSIGLPFPTPADSSMLLDGDDFSNIEDLLYTTDWTSLMADWSES
ncbi:hypothetical protein PILCRDRAFT_724526 [Piloderma croceum F 1598]|uniref:Xylanolytic transcriptional activator regulatory domain-containing protein n=1 Tax=Piloderma croceum (strain F 1598) TaxID=765440 RepID=A0A0C3F117_PILCF|nr:hypothetical protein PILCRDRAFT_724526 [Piloderma croceum F 1598]